jgi:hypothetical protein
MPRESFRAFSPEVETLAQAWSENTRTADPWKHEGYFLGESVAVKMSSGSLLGVVKPGRKKFDKICRAAHEKIAADLAFELRLPIPPVILLDLGELKDINRERYVAVSAFPFAQPSSWAQASPTFSDDHRAETSQVMSAMLGFETWVSCGDRKEAHVLAYLPAPDQPLQLAFIDYAFSMSQVWKTENDPAGRTGPYLPVQRDDNSLRIMIARIGQFDDGKIETIVNRIPAEYLPTAKKTLIIANLNSRKQRLHMLFGLQ